MKTEDAVGAASGFVTGDYPKFVRYQSKTNKAMVNVNKVVGRHRLLASVFVVSTWVGGLVDGTLLKPISAQICYDFLACC